jgi:phosphatidate cytidylyltransferase
MKRIATALVGVPATLVLTLYAPNWLFAWVAGIAGAAGLEEVLRLGAARMETRPGRWVLPVGVLVTAAFAGGTGWGMTGVAGAMLFVGVVVTFSVTLKDALPKAALATLGIVYCCGLLGFVVLLSREMRVVLLAVVWVGEAAAYYGGRTLGRHPLAPGISPKKTVEGAFAGLIGSVTAGVVLGVYLTDHSSGPLLAAAFLAGLAAQAGDLAESALKRSAGVKDSSAILPGHGGMLDRLDGILFAAPVLYWFFAL